MSGRPAIRKHYWGDHLPWQGTTTPYTRTPLCASIFQAGGGPPNPPRLALSRVAHLAPRPLACLQTIYMGISKLIALMLALMWMEVTRYLFSGMLMTLCCWQTWTVQRARNGSLMQLMISVGRLTLPTNVPKTMTMVLSPGVRSMLLGVIEARYWSRWIL